MAASGNGATRMETTRERMVGSSAPGSLDVRMNVVSAGGSSSSLSNALAASGFAACGTIRSASPITKTFRRAIAGDLLASCTSRRVTYL
jgi:hypothetical protein